MYFYSDYLTGSPELLQRWMRFMIQFTLRREGEKRGRYTACSYSVSKANVGTLNFTKWPIFSAVCNMRVIIILTIIYLIHISATHVSLLLGALAKLWAATINFVTSVHPSVRLHETTRLPLDGFSWNKIFGYFSKICRVSSSFFRIWQE
jgi:hypothetical protein